MENTKKTENIDTSVTMVTEIKVNDITDNGVTRGVTSAWKQWCRLCGKEDPQGNVNVFFKDEQMTANLTLSASIRKYFYIDITEDDDLPKMLCTKCFSLVTSLVNFTELTKKVQDMFSALHNTNTANPAIDINLQEIRLKYGLEDNDGYHMLLNRSTKINCSDSNISGTANCAFNKENIENTAHQIKMEAIWIDDYKDEIKDINDEEDISKNLDCLGESEVGVEADNIRSNDNFGTKEKSDLSAEPNNEPPKKRLRRNRNDHVAKDKDTANENSNVDSSHKHSVEQPNLVCTECGRKFRHLSHYDQHMKRIHNTKLDNSLLQCSQKNRSAYLKYSKKNRHIGMITNNESGEYSNIRVYQMNSSKILHSHLLVHSDQKKHKCKYCGRQFRQGKTLKNHLVIHTGLKPFTCNFCDKTFSFGSSCRKHKKKLHPQELAALEASGKPKKSGSLELLKEAKKFICDKCGMASKSMGALNEHILTHTEERPFECEVCNKGFKNKTQLKCHLEIHDAHKHICPRCGLQLNSSKTLHSHLLIHSDQKKFKCDYCGRQFKQGKTLKNHLIIHTGLKPYTCNFCDKTFSFGSSCREHKKRVHPKELAALEAAGETPKFTTNIPSLELLKAVTKAAVNAKL